MSGRPRVAGLVMALALSAGALGRSPAALAQSPPGAARTEFVVRVVPEARAAVGGAGDAVTVGDPFWVTIRAAGPAGSRLLPQSVIDAYASHPELAVLESRRGEDAWSLKVALFRPGDVVLPLVQGLAVTARGDTVPVTVVADTMRVASVLAPGDTVLADIKPVWRPSGVPWWVWAAAAALAAALAAWLVWRRLRREPAAVAARRPPRDVYRETRRRIEVLAAEPPDPEAGVLAAGGIGDAMREYLAEGWGVAARERTTLELLPVLPGSLADERASLGVILSAADLAKFARVAPRAGEVPALAGRALATLDRIEAIRARPPVPAETAPAASCAPAPPGASREAS